MRACICLTNRRRRGQVPRQFGWFDLSTHFPWIGMRTVDPDGAHVEYFRGIRNSFGLKVGPNLSAQCLKRLIRILNPENELGRLTLIHRFGSERIAALLPRFIEAAGSTGSPVLWCCDQRLPHVPAIGCWHLGHRPVRKRFSTTSKPAL